MAHFPTIRLPAHPAFLLTLAVLSAHPGVASGISLVSVTRDYSAQVALGGGIWEGSNCISSVGVDPDCEDQAVASGAVDPALPILDTGIANVSSSPGADNVHGNAKASLSASFLPRTSELFRVRQGVSVGGRDAAPGGFFTTLDATAASTSTVVIDTSLSLAPDQWLEMTVSLLFTHDGVAASVFSGSYQIVDLDTGDTLASLAVGSADPVTLDISALVGHRLQASFSGEAGVSLPAGFGGGAGPLADRDFFHNVEGQVALQIVPEPDPAVLLGLGLAALTAHRRRDAANTRSARAGRAPSTATPP